MTIDERNEYFLITGRNFLHSKTPLKWTMIKEKQKGREEGIKTRNLEIA